MPPAADAPPRSPSARGSSNRSATPSSTTRRQPTPGKAKSGRVRQLVRPALALITLVLIADALVGENGWFERQREQVRLEDMTGTLDRVRQENADLDVRVKRLDAADPAAIEDLARRKLEMLKPGEVLFIAATLPDAADARDASSPAAR